MRKRMCIESIKKIENEFNVRLLAFIEIGGEKQECWFDYPLEYSEYVCDERIDAFVIALIPYAMRRNLDIISTIPISEKLSYQIHNYYIPVLSKYQATFNKIELLCPYSSVNYNTGEGGGRYRYFLRY